jgi:hypothetical protein
MKRTVLFFLLVAPVWGQSSIAQNAVAPGCGAEDERFDVKMHKGQHPTAQLEEGKALVYFMEDDSDYGPLFKPTTRAGLDGVWMGATHGNSYFYFSVAPVEHHLCASWQPEDASKPSHTRAVAHFTAEADEVYYFRAKNMWTREYGAGEIEFAELDSDEGALLASSYSWSTFRVKK